MKNLGIDIGAYSIKLAVLDENGSIISRTYVPHHNRVKEEMEKLYQSLDENEVYRVCVTGSRSHLLNLKEQDTIFEKKALLAAFKVLSEKNNAASCVVLGAQNTYYINARDLKKNSNCSAGTGAFFEEQAGRLQIKLEDISRVVSEAKNIPQIAGRCSVFSKTDMIHRMQEGCTTADILNGLCYAMVRNYKSTILANREVEKPVMLAGGVMHNTGAVNAIKDLFSLKDSDLLLDENADYLPALGAAYSASAENEYKKQQLLENLKLSVSVTEKSQYKPLKEFARPEDKKVFATSEYNPSKPYYLGIDIGSTSTNFVITDEDRNVLYYDYVRTLGKPLDIVKSGLERIKSAFPEIRLEGTAVTGSGREYIGKQINATLVINEITAQTEGALLFNRDIDNVFEIGGQDSKYMQVKGGKMTDFEMNKVCAAGTGAFLEEQIKKLGISMEQFLDLAMKSENPCELGDRCTVFIEGSINQKLSEGEKMEDVCAGLAYAIVSNYLHRVVNKKAIGEKIALQGGIAYNQAVICAFRALTGKEIVVSEYFSVTGALGAASLCMKKSALHFDREKNSLINARLLEQSEASYLKNYHAPEAGSTRKRVGVPRVIFLHKMFPLFNTLFTTLGFDVVISPLTNAEIVSRASRYVTAETCYPIKLIYGHISWLLDQKVDYIVLPRLYTIKHEGSVARKDYSCMYMQTSPLLMEQAFHLKERGVTLIMPELSLQFGKKFMVKSLLSIGKQIGVPVPLMIPAAIKGFASLVAHSQRLEKIGKESLQGDEPVFVLISRVYNIADPVLNMGIEEYLNSIGCRVVHLEHLEASYMNVAHDYKDMYWPFGQHILTGLKIIRANRNFYPIYITNHGCGPDTAIQHFFQNEMEGREYLQLEVDEHSSKVGVITRLEAFLYSLQPQTEILNKKWETETGKKADFTLIPDFGMYTEILEKYLPENHAPVLKVKPLTQHHSFNYSMNKEYYTMVLFLEEIENALKEKGSSYVYDFYCPIDEGSEVFGQYALLVYQELKKQGYQVNLRNFYLEDLVKRNDAAEIYSSLIEAEKEQLEKAVLPSDRKSAAYDYSMLIGEPMCIYKEACGNKSLLGPSAAMPLSEAFLFHMRMIRGYENYSSVISRMKSLHDKAMKETESSGYYSDITVLEDLCRNKLDFSIGNFAKYRFAKLLALDPSGTARAYVLNSSEENAAIILNRLYDQYSSEIKVPYRQLNLDFEHDIQKEDLL